MDSEGIDVDKFLSVLIEIKNVESVVDVVVVVEIVVE